MKRRVLLLVALLLVVVLATVRVEGDAQRGVWHVWGPGLTIVGLNDREAGPVLWFYWGDKFMGRWQWREEESRPGPTGTPYPTSTPYPTYTPQGQQQA